MMAMLFTKNNAFILKALSLVHMLLSFNYRFMPFLDVFSLFSHQVPIYILLKPKTLLKTTRKEKELENES